MGLGLSLVGKSGKKGLLGFGKSGGIDLRRIAEWLSKHGTPVLPVLQFDGPDRLAATLIHGEESVFITTKGNEVHIEARTSSAGPGYHRWICETLRKLGQDLEIVWSATSKNTFDETGFWESGRTDQLEHEMRLWLQQLAQTILDQSREGEAENLSICMPTEAIFEANGSTRTQLGPRDIAWWERVAATGDGSDFWIWPDYGFTPSFFVNQARVLMSLEVCWRPPLDENETLFLQGIDQFLTEARKLDPNAPVPAREWVAIKEYLEAPVDSSLRDEAGKAKGPLLGYRRRPITHRLTPTWSFKLDGQLWTGWDEKRERFEAYDADSWISFTPYKRGDPNGAIPPAKGEPVDLPDPRLQGSAGIVWQPEDGERWILSATLASGSKLAVVIIVRSVQADKQWVLDTLKGVQLLDG